jgi:glycosyltransferase involved in cell wall biosynthesis
MKLAILAPITWRTPPRQYGPWEQVASVLTESLVEMGLDVTLFATGDSITKAHLEFVCEKPLGEYPADHKVWECLHISNLMEHADRFDLIHNHFDFLPLTWSSLINTPIITTIHGFSSQAIVPVYKKYNKHSHYVAISNSDRHPALTYLDTVYNGVDERLFDAGTGKGGYLLYFGRIHPHKGAYEAIQIALKTRHRLLICGLVQDEEYFQKMVKPWIDGKTVIYKGNVDPVQRNELLGEALALLHPISFEEPFGLSVAESMLCGTPVIAFDRGSMKELIIHERTGFLISDIEEAVQAVGKIDQISRSDCRAHALTRFTRGPMARHYLRLYEQILSKKPLLASISS